MLNLPRLGIDRFGWVGNTNLTATEKLVQVPTPPRPLACGRDLLVLVAGCWLCCV